MRTYAYAAAATRFKVSGRQHQRNGLGKHHGEDSPLLNLAVLLLPLLPRFAIASDSHSYSSQLTIPIICTKNQF